MTDTWPYLMCTECGGTGLIWPKPDPPPIHASEHKEWRRRWNAQIAKCCKACDGEGKRIPPEWTEE